MKQGVLRTADFWTGLGLVGLGAIWANEALAIYAPPFFSDLLGPRAFPVGLSVSIATLGAVILVRSVARGAERADVGELRVLGTVAASIIAYALLFRVIGFIVATFLFLAFIFTYLGERRYWLTVGIALAITAALYLGFGLGLHVNLPRGPFGF